MLGQHGKIVLEPIDRYSVTPLEIVYTDKSGMEIVVPVDLAKQLGKIAEFHERPENKGINPRSH